MRPVIVFLACVVPASAHAQPPDLPPGTWWEAPDSRIDDHLPDPLPPGMTGPSAIISAWSGAAFDTQRERLIIWGGGHGDYGGNELYAFDVASLTWSRIWGPSPGIDDIPAECSPTEEDGAPTSRHTYDGIEYVPTADRLFAYGGARFCGNSGADDLTWLFDFDSGSWTTATNIPETLLTSVAAYDPTNDRVYALGRNQLYGWDPTGDSWTPRAEICGGFWNTAVGEVDDSARQLVVIGDGEVWIWDMASWTAMENVMTVGGEAIVEGRPGLAYDPTLERIVAWNGGTSVYSFDPIELRWFEHAAASDNSVTPTAPDENGTFGRFRYIPSRNLFVVVNAIDENVYFYKLSEGGGTPVVPPPDGGFPDAGVGGDGGMPPAEEEDSGCGCNAPGQRVGWAPLSLLILLGALTFRRRQD